MQHAVGQALAAAATDIHDALCTAPVKRVLQADLAAAQAQLCEVGHRLLEILCERLIPLDLVVLRAIHPRFKGDDQLIRSPDSAQHNVPGQNH